MFGETFSLYQKYTLSFNDDIFYSPPPQKKKKKKKN